ncbi:uncharacterized protein LOC135321892 [Camelus dromedarius]|uniref:uncharacterized protein LOC135321892 n=1 Tax=Camelus dromedarius TaxID=9838 RepID=UPI003119ED89
MAPPPLPTQQAEWHSCVRRPGAAEAAPRPSSQEKAAIPPVRQGQPRSAPLPLPKATDLTAPHPRSKLTWSPTSGESLAAKTPPGQAAGKRRNRPPCPGSLPPAAAAAAAPNHCTSLPASG